MIPLDRLLDRLDVAVEPFLVYDLRRQCPLDCGGVDAATIHYTLSGSGVLELAGGATVRFSTHSVTVLPPRLRARIVAERGARRMVTARAHGDPAPAEWAKVEAADGDPDILIATGRIRASYRGSIDLFGHLREPLVERLADDDPIRQSFEELLDEIAAQRPGSRAMAETLLRRCLILLLRHYCTHGDHRPSWLAALEDERLGRAVAAMQDRPEHPFTLPEVADIAGMSRSVFAAHFADALGRWPIEFLKTLRLARAAQLLVRTELPVKTVSAEVGYLSRSSFTHAFLARYGVGPTAFRAAPGKAASRSPADPSVLTRATVRRGRSRSDVPQGPRGSPALRARTRDRRIAPMREPDYAIQTDLMLTNSRMPYSDSSRP